MNNPEANKQTVVRYFNHIARGEVKEAADLYTDDGAITVPSSTSLPDGVKGRQAVQDLIAQVLTVFPETGLKLTVDLMTAEENRVAAVAHGVGAINAAGKAYDNRYHFLFIFEGSKIKECFEYMDSLLLQQVFFADA